MSIQRITRTLAAGLVLALAGPLLAGALAQATFQLTVTPSAGSAGQTITATYSSSSRDAINGFLDWSDGTEEAVTIGPVAASRSHVYAAPGTYAVRLLSVDFTVLAVRTVTIRPGLRLLNLDLQFVKPQAGKTLAVLPGAEVDVVLTYTYTGSGTMLGRWQWLPPGGPMATEEVLVNLPGTSTSGQITLTGLPTDGPGTGTVTFVVLELEPAPGGLPAIAAPIAYSVQLPPITGAKWLLVGGFQIEIRQVTNPSPQAFAGDGWLDLVVGGAAAGKRLIAFSGLPVHAEGEVVTATAGQVQALWDPPVGVKPPAIGPSELRLTRLVLSPQGGRLDGYATVHAPLCFIPFQFSPSGELLTPDPAQASAAGPATAQVPTFGPVSLVNAFSPAALQQAAQQPPAAKQPGAFQKLNFQQAADLGAVKIIVPPQPEPFGKITFLNAPLTPAGDLYTSALIQSPEFQLGCTGLLFKTTTPGGSPMPAVLDLSSQQSPNLLPLAYAAHQTPPDLGAAWHGILVTGARFDYLGAVKIENWSAPLAYSGGGYHTRLTTGPGGLTAKVHGWDLTTVTLELGVIKTELVAAGGTGKVFVPFFGRNVDLTIAPTPGGGWSVTTTGIVVKDFGLTGVVAGKGFIKTNGDLVFPDAVWAIGEIATANTLISANLPSGSPAPGSKATMNDVAAAGPAGQAMVSLTIFGTPAPGQQKASNLAAGSFYALGPASGNAAVSQAAAVSAYPGGALNFFQIAQEFGGHDAALKALGVQLPLVNLRFNEAQAQAGKGSAGVLLSGADGLHLSGYPFPATSVRVQLVTGNRYALVVVGKLQPGAQLPAAGAHYRYYVRQGADDGREMVRFAFKTTLNGMTLDFPQETVAIQGNPGTTLPGASEIAGTARVRVRDIDVEASYLFGRQTTGESYWYVWSSVASNPLVSFPGVSVYEFHGGAAYRMQWPAGSFKAKPGYVAGAGLTVAAGAILGTNDSGYTLHADGTMAFQASGAVTILVNGWVFTELPQGAKAANSQPHARARIVVTDQGFNFSGCVGASGSPKPPHAQVTCSGLRDLELAGVVKASGWLELNAPFKGDDYYLMVGTPKATVWVRLLDLVTAEGYLMVGRIPGAHTSSGQVQTGYFTGGKISFLIKEGGGGNVNFLFSSCSYGWSIQAGATFGADFALTVKPVAVSAGIKVTVSLTAGVHGCGIGLSLGAGVTLTGTVTAPNPRQFSGSITIFISPPVIPDIGVTFNRTFNF